MEPTAVIYWQIQWTVLNIFLLRRDFCVIHTVKSAWSEYYHFCFEVTKLQFITCLIFSALVQIASHFLSPTLPFYQDFTSTHPNPAR